MIRMLLICLSIASFSVLHICSLTKDASKATFELYSGESHGTMTRLFDKIFHQCSLEDDCNFVAKNTNTKSFKKYSHEANLLKDKKTLVVFKKTLIYFQKEKSGKKEFDPGSLYVGCYNDRRSRALPLAGSMKKHDAIGMTEQCIKKCKSRGDPYAGLQGGQGPNCFCGTAYAKYGAAAESGCDKPCQDYSGRMCGGHWKNSIYRTS